jgi:hypothetical protein
MGYLYVSYYLSRALNKKRTEMDKEELVSAGSVHIQSSLFLFPQIEDLVCILLLFKGSHEKSQDLNIRELFCWVQGQEAHSTVVWLPTPKLADTNLPSGPWNAL